MCSTPSGGNYVRMRVVIAQAVCQLLLRYMRTGNDRDRRVAGRQVYVRRTADMSRKSCLRFVFRTYKQLRGGKPSVRFRAVSRKAGHGHPVRMAESRLATLKNGGLRPTACFSRIILLVLIPWRPASGSFRSFQGVWSFRPLHGSNFFCLCPTHFV